MTSVARKIAAGTAAVVFFGTFLGLGTWQVERRAWKLALIDRVERRVHAPAVPAPPPAEWPSITAAGQEYRHIRASGVLLTASQTRVQALTELGAGYWVMTPLRMTDGAIVLLNRGFVPAEASSPPAAADAAATQEVTVTGLLRMPEPGGAFLRRNEPAAGRWYSRDVAAIAAARHLGPVAPYFIDADGPASGGADAAVPVGGLTVIAFYNNHLIYAITWYTLALMIPTALWFARRSAAAAKMS